MHAAQVAAAGELQVNPQSQGSSTLQAFRPILQLRAWVSNPFAAEDPVGFKIQGEGCGIQKPDAICRFLSGLSNLLSRQPF